MRRVSERQKGRTALYYFLREPFMRNNPTCQICESAPSQECHHRKYRAGRWLFDQAWWLAVCVPCHQKIHGNIKWARQNGYLV